MASPWFILSLPFFFLVESARIRKCCPEDQYLDYLECANRTFYTELQDESGLPWWFPNNTKIISQETNEPMASFPTNLKISPGTTQPCCISETAFLFSNYYNFQFYDNGSLLVHAINNRYQSRDIIYPPESFCVDSLVYPEEPMALDFMVLLCPCRTTVCVLKCCELDMRLTIPAHGVISDYNCVRAPESGSSWKPNGIKEYFILNRFPHCSIDEEVVIVKASGHIFHDNGSVTLSSITSHNLKFCADDTDANSTYLLRCHPRQGDQGVGLRRILYGSLSAVGTIFLLLTLLIYHLLPRQLTLNDKNLLAQTWSLTVGYIGLTVSQLFINSIPHSLCVVIGFVILYSFLASFFWLNVLCIDLAWAFSEGHMMRRMHSRSGKRFIQFSVYAWISPFVIVICTLIAELAPQIVILQSLHPHFFKKCWFSNDSLGKLAFFYGPIAILLGINVVLFLYTAYKIYVAQKQADSLIKNNVIREKKRVMLYLKLMSLMGLTWVFELISWAVGGPDYYWYGTDMLNLFRAVFIFITLCCKKEVYQEMRQKWHSPKPRGRQLASPSVTTLNSQLALDLTAFHRSNLTSSNF